MLKLRELGQGWDFWERSFYFIFFNLFLFFSQQQHRGAASRGRLELGKGSAGIPAAPGWENPQFQEPPDAPSTREPQHRGSHRTGNFGAPKKALGHPKGMFGTPKNVILGSLNEVLLEHPKRLF